MAKSIMIQGTMSNVGKSILVTGLCRIFHQDGYRVAPFKSQNMALNSYITREGLEMGRAQVAQAEAAKLEPSILMNPILLKPVTNMGSQLIVNGEVQGTYKARDYYNMKHTLLPQIINSYQKLAAENDIIVIEGAGSPAEINLNKDDFVNMGMAKLSNSPVLLAGDIDRGGVFAQLYGTIKLLPKDEQDIIKGLIINKFRGDKTLLSNGISMLENLTDKRVIGTVSMIDIDIDDEDSLSSRLTAKNDQSKLIDIVAIKLPKLSNFTDLSPLECMPNIGVRYVDKCEELGNPDLIVIPGTKNTIADLKWLKNVGLSDLIISFAHLGTPIIGICGGYQMLGKEIIDSSGVEDGGSEQGLGLLNTKTYFENSKRRTRVVGHMKKITGFFKPLSEASVSGYEIHMGKTEAISKVSENIISLDNGFQDGYVNDNILGTYLHGFFEDKEIRNSLIDLLAEKKGIKYKYPVVDWNEYKESQYNKLADELRSSLNMDLVYKILEEGI